MSSREPIALSWSGGKDSTLALAALRADARYDVVALVTSVTTGYERISIHGVRRELLDAQVRAVGLPLYEVVLEPSSSNEAYEAAFRQGVESLRADFPTLRKIAFGDLFLEDVRAYRERLLAPMGLEGVFPLWGLDTGDLARQFVREGYRAHLVCVDTTQLSGAFAGRTLDASLIADLPETADPCGERGEYHSFVWDGPVFATPVPVVRGEVVLRDGRFAYCDLFAGERRIG
jgi:uncharacterized protein (TIGR00290 family)